MCAAQRPRTQRYKLEERSISCSSILLLLKYIERCTITDGEGSDENVHKAGKGVVRREEVLDSKET